MAMTVSQRMKAGRIINEYRAKAQNEGVIVVLVSEDGGTDHGSFSNENRSRLVRCQPGCVFIYADEDTFEGLDRNVRYWIMVFQRNREHETYGPLYWSDYRNPARLTDSKGREARSRNVAGGKAYSFTHMDARSSQAGGDLLKGRFPNL